MPRRRTVAAFAAVSSIGLLRTAPSHAYCRTTTCDTCVAPVNSGECVIDGAALYWPVNCVTYDVQQDASKFADLATATEITDLAFASWKNVVCPGNVSPSFELANLGPVACSKHEYNDQQQTFGGNANIIVFRDDSWTATDDPHTLALTTVTYNKNTGEIYDSDIEVNSHIQIGSIGGGISTETPVPGNSFDLQSILTHEAGHFLGLAHSNVDCRTTATSCPSMDANYRTGSDDFRTLEQDDINGICAIYPEGRPAMDNECAPRHGFASDCGTPGHKGCCSTAPGAASSRGGAGLFAAGLGLAVFAARGRRRRA
jgi:Matrixin